MKTPTLLAAVVFAALSSGCSAEGLFVGSLKKTITRTGYETLVVSDSQAVVDATPSRTGKWIILRGVTQRSVAFERVGSSIALAPALSDRLYEEESQSSSYTAKTDFTSGDGTYSPSALSFKLAATETFTEDTDTWQTTIAWEFHGAPVE